MKLINKLFFPTLFTLSGLGLLLYALSNEQNTYFIFASFILMLVGASMYFMMFGKLTKQVQLALLAVFGVASLLLTSWSISSIKEPLDFEGVKNTRYPFVIQKLKDIREAQILHKKVTGVYASTLDSLVLFINTGKVPVVKAIGDRPDTLTEEQALKKGLMRRDTVYVSASEALFSEDYKKSRFQGVPFVVDSIPFIPFSKGAQFEMETGEVDKNDLKVKTLLVYTPKEVLFGDIEKVELYRDLKDLSFGSSSEPILNGNWE